MLPPDFSHAPRWARPLFDTLAMSIGGTAIAVVLSLAICDFFAAANTSPHPAAYPQRPAFLLNAAAQPYRS